MRNSNGKKGFTLIELLAVIVVLGIVAVIGAFTVLPQLENARKEAIVTEANNAKEAAVAAMTLVTMGSGDVVENTNYTKTTSGTNTVYCFTLEQLVNLGIWTKSTNDLGTTAGKYEGRIKVTVPAASGAYTYETYMTNHSYYVYGNGTLTSSGNVSTSATSGQSLGC